MSSMIFTHGAQRYCVDLTQPIDLSIAVDFNAATLKAFGAAPPSAEPMQVGRFIGDVHQGSSCNCATLHLTAHCHGTHTESVGHLTRQPCAVAQLAKGLYLAKVITLAVSTGLIDLPMLRAQLEKPNCTAVIIRTLPNAMDKRTRNYDQPPTPPWFSAEALAWLADSGIEHLLVDVPSVDRMDDPQLLAHRAFWGLPAGSTDLIEARRAQATITELIYVPDDIPDGSYLLNLQVAPLNTDAAPSRPVLYALVDAANC